MPHIHELYDFTTSAFILHPSKKLILLLKHKKLGIWLQPGGHVELNEHPLETLHHEIQEETGLLPEDYTILEPADHPAPTGGTNTVLPLPFYFNYHNFKDTEHRHIDMCYLLQAHTDKITDSPDGADAIGWYSLQKIKQFAKDKHINTDTLQICEWIFKHSYPHR